MLENKMVSFRFDLSKYIYCSEHSRYGERQRRVYIRLINKRTKYLEVIDFVILDFKSRSNAIVLEWFENIQCICIW